MSGLRGLGCACIARGVRLALVETLQSIREEAQKFCMARLQHLKRLAALFQPRESLIHGIRGLK